METQVSDFLSSEFVLLPAFRKWFCLFVLLSDVYQNQLADCFFATHESCFLNYIRRVSM